jgi:hypothetical protein
MSSRSRKTCRRSGPTTSKSPREEGRAQGHHRRLQRALRHQPRINEFDLYYQDVQKRIKDQQFPNADLPKKGREKIDITIVVDMLLTGFDSKYLNTLYVDKNLKHHGLIQAFSRTNRVLNATKPYGNILDFRGSRTPWMPPSPSSPAPRPTGAREIWLVDKAPVVIEKLKTPFADLDDFMQSQGLEAKPEAVPNLKGDDARAAFIKRSRKCSAPDPARPVHRPHRREQEQIEQVCCRGRASRLPRRLPGNRPAPQGAAGQARRGGEPGPRSTSSTSSSSSSPPPSSTTTTS